jgi:hypothetical protein
MQYLSLAPIALALGDKRISEQWDTTFEKHEAEEEQRKRKKAMLVEKLKLHKVIARPPTQKESALPTLIEQVNCSFELDTLLQKNIGSIGRRMKRALSVSERVVESANNLWDYVCESLWYFLTVWLWPIAAQLFILALMAHRIAAEYILRFLDWRWSPDAPALKDVSATAQQIDIRLQQFCYWPIQYLTLRKRKSSWGSITNSHPEYIRFYNSLWLVANDVIMGIALGSFIIENSSGVAAQVDTIFSAWSIEGLRRMISWLTGWPPPGGLKLNTELAAFLGDLFLWVIEYWAGMCSVLYITFSEADTCRNHVHITTPPASPRPNHWILSVCWSYNAHLAVLRRLVFADVAHLLVLHCLCPYLPLAVDDHHFAFPPLPWQKTQHTSKSNRLLRLRPRPAASGYNPLYAAVLLATNGVRLLSDIRKRKSSCHRAQSWA